jgi:hypothetical protein
MPRLAPFLLAFAGLVAISCGAAPAKSDRVQASYDQKTKKLSQLTVDSGRDGKPNIFSYMEGTRFVRIEIDNDEDGNIDRWEYFGSDQKLEKVGLSGSNDGRVDRWVYKAPDGSIGKVEVSTRRNGKVDRTEFYEKGVIVRAEADGDGDGRADKWETYANGVLATVAFDTTHTGTADRIIDYRRESAARPSSSK